MQTSYDRLKIFVKAKYFGNMTNFANDLGINPVTISIYKNRGVVLPIKYKDRIEELGLNWDWYESGTGEMLLNKANTGDVHENFKLVIKNIDKLSMAEIKEFIQAARNMSEEMVS